MFYVLPKIKSFYEYRNFIFRKSLGFLSQLLILNLLTSIGKFVMQSYTHINGIPAFAYYKLDISLQR